ncbi:MAG: hypothetical protein JKY56_23090 [Kofleriaceae bacterium]|nr:hypothetical protein [Kofleriaceae bacterium]
MGLFQIMRSSALVVINVHAGRRTEVISILDLGESHAANQWISALLLR